MNINKNIEREIWKEAAYRCSNPNCRVSSFIGHLNIHHIIGKEFGGTDEPENLILLCSNCHDLYHYAHYFSKKVILSWKKGLKTRKITINDEAYNEKYYNHINNKIYIGHAIEIIGECEEIFLNHSDPNIRLRYGILYVKLLHVMDHEDEALKQSIDLINIYENNSEKQKFVRNGIEINNIKARILRRKLRLIEAKQILEITKKKAIDEQYIGWQLDYYQSWIDLIALEQQLNNPNINSYKQAELIFDELISLDNTRLMTMHDKANLLGGVRVQKANFHSYTENYAKAYEEMNESLEHLLKFAYRRAIVLRLANKAVYIMNEMNEKKADKTFLAEKASNLLIKSISLGTFNSNLEINQTIAGGSIALSKSYLPYLTQGKIPPSLRKFKSKNLSEFEKKN